MKYITGFIILLIFALATQISCTKYRSVRDDTAGDSSIYGRLILVDTLLGTGNPTPIGKQIVFLGYGMDSTASGDYLIAAKTDSAGYFLFLDLRAGFSYSLLFTDTVSGLVYKADTIISKLSDDSVALYARPSLISSTGFKYKFIDGASPGGEAVPGVQVCIFTSPTLAYAYKTDSCQGSNYQLVSDNQGRAAMYGIPPGKYYAYIHTSYAALPVSRLDSFTVVTNTPLVMYEPLP